MGSPESRHERAYRQLLDWVPEGFDVSSGELRALAATAVESGRVRVPWGFVHPARVLMALHGISRSKAFELLAEYGTRKGRSWSLSNEAMRAIDDRYRPRRVRQALIAYRMRDSGSTRAAAERWVDRMLARQPEDLTKVERAEPDPEARTVDGQARTLERLAELWPDAIRTHTRTHNGVGTGGAKGTPTDSD